MSSQGFLEAARNVSVRRNGRKANAPGDQPHVNKLLARVALMNLEVDLLVAGEDQTERARINTAKAEAAVKLEQAEELFENYRRALAAEEAEAEEDTTEDAPGPALITPAPPTETTEDTHPGGPTDGVGLTTDT